MSGRPGRQAAKAASSKLADLLHGDDDDDGGSLVTNSSEELDRELNGSSSSSSSAAAAARPSAAKRKKSDDDDDEDFEISSNKKAKPSARDDNDDDHDDESLGSGFDEEGEGGGSSSSSSAAKPKKPRRSGIGKRTAFKKQLMALTHEQLAELVTDFFSPGGGGAELHDAFVRSLPQADISSLITDLTKASRAIDRSQPRYANGDDFAYKRCAGVIQIFCRLVGTQVKTLVSGSAFDELVRYIPDACRVIGGTARFSVNYQYGCRENLGKAVARALKAKTITPAQAAALRQVAVDCELSI